MKILLLAPQPFYQVRGTPIAIDLLLTTLSKQGHIIDLLTYHEGEDRRYENVKHTRIASFAFLSNIQPGFSFKKLLCSGLLFLSAIKLIRNNQYDLIHANEETVFMAVLFNKIFKLPYVYDMDSSLVGQMIDKMPVLKILSWPFTKFENMAIRNSIGVLAVCEALCKIARPRNNNVKLLTDVAMLDRLNPGDDIVKLDQEISSAGTKLMYIGNLETYQGIDLLIESFEIALKTDASLHLIFIGGSEDTIAFYKTKCLALGIEQSVVFTGPKPFSDIEAYMQQADILVSPRTKGENTPMKIYNYMASGKPIIATNIYSHTQALDENNSLLVEVNPNALAEGIIKLSKSRKLQKSLAENCLSHAKKHYSVESFEIKVSDFFQGIQKTLSVSSS